MSTSLPSTPTTGSATTYRSVTPHLVCAGATEALDFYVKAFGGTEVMRLPGADGRLMHGALRIGDSMVMIADEFPEWQSLGPASRGGTSVTLHLYVSDVDTAFARAVDAGCKVILPVQDMFWGDRYGVLQDPFGHQWSLATHVRDVDPEELRQRAQQGCGDCSG